MLGALLGARVVGDTLGGELGVTVGSVLGEALGETFGDALGNTLGDVLGDALGDMLGHALGGTLGEALGVTIGDALGEPLLSWLANCVDDMFQFVFTNFWFTPGSNVTTTWLSREKQPQVAPELAARLRAERLLREDPTLDLAGVEWWAR